MECQHCHKEIKGLMKHRNQASPFPKSRNRNMFTLKHGLLLLGFAAFAVQTGFSQLLPAGTTMNWTGNVGVEGGIPTYSTVYSNFSPNAFATAANISAALAACPSGNVVSLSAGNYYFTNDILYLAKSFVVLRGAGT